MLTPPFELTQNDNSLIVSIQVPYAKLSEVEVHHEDTEFMFYSKPYYLRLNLPGKVDSSIETSCKYDVDKRTFIIHVPKAQKGEVFQGLDLISLLLAPKKGKHVGGPKIEVLESTSDAPEIDEEIDWNIEQTQAEDDFGSITFSGQQCGFANTYSFSVFSLKEEVYEIFDVSEPQTKTPKMCSEERLQVENKRFDEEYYLADLYEDDQIQQLMIFKPEWVTLHEDIEDNSTIPDDEKIHFTSEEKDRLRKLPNKELLLDKSQSRVAFLGLVDILFAYAYNKRTTEGENTVESAWTINKISATLSWLETFSSITDVAISCIRRSLIYPLFRHFELSVTVLEDVRKIIMLGRKYVIKCLLEIHEMFNLSEPRYILNDLFITDYILWMQTKSCASKKLVPLAETLGKVLLTKGDIGLNLVDIETIAKVAWMSRDTLSLNSNTVKTKEPKTTTASTRPQDQPNNSTETDLCSGIGKLSLGANSKETGEAVSRSSSASESNSQYEECSSCTSDSSESSSSFETYSSVDSDDSSSVTDSDDDSDSSNSDNNSYSRLLRGASIGERLH